MSGWRQFVESIRQEERAGTIGTKGTETLAAATFVPIDPIVLQAPSPDPATVLRDGHQRLAAIEPGRTSDRARHLRWRQAI